MAKCEPGRVQLLFELMAPRHCLYSTLHLSHTVCRRGCGGALGLQEMGPLDSLECSVLSGMCLCLGFPFLENWDSDSEGFI